MNEKNRFNETEPEMTEETQNTELVSETEQEGDQHEAQEAEALSAPETAETAGDEADEAPAEENAAADDAETISAQEAESTEAAAAEEPVIEVSEASEETDHTDSTESHAAQGERIIEAQSAPAQGNKSVKAKKAPKLIQLTSGRLALLVVICLAVSLLGGLGGLFLLGLATRRANATGALCGLGGSIVVQTLVTQHQWVNLLLYSTTGFIACFAIGYVVSLEGIVDTSPESSLAFRPLEPALTADVFIAWKRYQVFSPAAAPKYRICPASTSLPLAVPVSVVWPVKEVFSLPGSVVGVLASSRPTPSSTTWRLPSPPSRSLRLSLDRSSVGTSLVPLMVTVMVWGTLRPVWASVT